MVTGASGLVGQDLIKLLANKKNKVIALYNNNKNIKQEIVNKNIKWKKINLNQNFNLKENIDIIIHCAVTHNFSKKKNFFNYISSNIISIKNLINFAKKKILNS